MQVKSLTVGPIVGYTTQTSVRLWGRGEFKKQCYGVVELNNDPNSRKVFAMHPHFDWTGIVEFLGLTANQVYSYKIGYVISAANPDLTVLDFSNVSTYHFKTAPTNNYNNVSFAFGSCRYILGFLGLDIFDDRGDKTFRAILDQINPKPPIASRPIDLLLMLGDQIYADDLNIFTPNADALSNFHKRYQIAFSSKNLSALMSQVPTYMVLDDHEIQDNWTQDRYVSKHELYNVAMSAYQAYQLVHGPAFQFSNTPNFAVTPSKRYYSFDVGTTRFFITDVRTERYKDNNPSQIISIGQMAALKAWLQEKPNALKFIGTSVPFFPDLRISKKDKWSEFSDQRNELLDFIRRNNIKNVVFLSGDVHTSAWSTLTCPTDPSFCVHSIISSPFFWPHSFASKSDFISEGVLTTIDGHSFKVTNSGGFYSESNFTRVTSEQDKRLLVEIFDRKGGKLDATYLSLQ